MPCGYKRAVEFGGGRALIYGHWLCGFLWVKFIDRIMFVGFVNIYPHPSLPP
jgi:hypothetical protein